MGSKVGRPRRRDDVRVTFQGMLSTGPKFSYQITPVRKALNASHSVMTRALERIGAKKIPVGDVDGHIGQWQWYLPGQEGRLLPAIEFPSDMGPAQQGAEMVRMSARSRAVGKANGADTYQRAYTVPTLVSTPDGYITKAEYYSRQEAARLVVEDVPGPVDGARWDAVQYFIESVSGTDLRPWGYYRADQLDGSFASVSRRLKLKTRMLGLEQGAVNLLDEIGAIQREMQAAEEEGS